MSRSRFKVLGSREAPEDQAEAARAVQNRLLKLAPPRIRTLDVAGLSTPAMEVGGDFYDLFSAGSSRLGILLGDIAGKGVSAALLMASLQATVRSHYAVGNGGMLHLLRSVNRLFCEWTESHRYSTLFLGEYDDRTQRLAYVNCGQVPPVLLRAGGRLERLDPTATVIGVFPDWDGEVRDVLLHRGDILVVFSDGGDRGTKPVGGGVRRSSPDGCLENLFLPRRRSPDPESDPGSRELL